jgi:signal transduction histidine kinase
MSGDHLVFISVACVLIVSAVNTVVLNREHGWREGEAFWFWGLIALSISYLGFGTSAWFGPLALSVANLGLLVAYLAMSLQLRYWQTGKTGVPIWIMLGAIVYTILLEYLRATAPYTVRLHLIHLTMSLITAYLFYSTVSYYRKNGSTQLLVLASTFAIEFICAFSRLMFTVIQPAPTNQQMTLYEEPLAMVLMRWVWLMANAMSYLTVMTFELEKTLNKNETLRVLLKEKDLLLKALSRHNRSDQSAAIGQTLAHELRQPLTTLLLASKNLQAQLKSNELDDLETQVEFLCKQCERSANLINELENVFKPKRTDKPATAIADVINQAIHTLRPRLSAEHVEVRLRGSFACVVPAQATQLETVFINLISNSMNALSSLSTNRQITIESKAERLSCVVTVSDNGPGIDPSVLPNIWHLYVSDDKGGSGIGLWLSQQIVQNYSGQLEAGNTPDSGAWFRVVLPRLQSPHHQT